MPVIKTVSEYMTFIKKQNKDILNNKVSTTARNTLREHIVEDVYEAYEPTEYQRTGGLLQDENIETQVVKDTLTLRSIRRDDVRDIAEIVEYGEGYNYGLDEIIGPRPFHQNTYEELKAGRIKNSMTEGFLEKGFIVK